MNIYILRHAIAVPRGTAGYDDDDRPLTKEGIIKMKKNAVGMAKIIDDIGLIISSPLIRAVETARIAANELKYNKEIIITEYLIPGNKLQDLYNFLDQYKNVKSIMLVGHEPHLSYLASNLIGRDESVIEFKKGGLCLIQKKDISSVKPGILIWSVTPKQLRLISLK